MAPFSLFSFFFNLYSCIRVFSLFFYLLISAGGNSAVLDGFFKQCHVVGLDLILIPAFEKFYDYFLVKKLWSGFH